MKYLKSLILIFCSLLFISCGDNDNTSDAMDNDDNTSDVVQSTNAQYQITLTILWNATNFPTNYPSGAHFSSVIGMTHNASIDLFEEGTLASLGVIRVAETGGTSIMSSEISQFISNEEAKEQFVGSVTSTFSAELSPTHSYISFITMLAPSPDWFIGINALNLLENGEWIDSKELNLALYDAGSDSGPRFTSANSQSNPQETISKLISDSSDTDFEEGIHRTTDQYPARVRIVKIDN